MPPTPTRCATLRAAATRPGAIMPYPMPPAPIIRQAPGAHDEIRGVLRALRGAG